jgi:hypothetical protein
MSPQFCQKDTVKMYVVKGLVMIAVQSPKKLPIFIAEIS